MNFSEIFQGNATVLGQPKYFQPIKIFFDFLVISNKFSGKVSARSWIFLACQASIFLKLYCLIVFKAVLAIVLNNITRLFFIKDFYRYFKSFRYYGPNEKYVIWSQKFTDEPKPSGEQWSHARKICLPLDYPPGFWNGVE